MRAYSWLLAPLLLLGLACSGGSDTPAASDAPQGASGPRSASMFLNWFPEHQHGGFYAAQVGGLYREEGIEMTIQGGGPGAPVVPRVDTGQVDFGVANADEVLLAVAQGADVVALMAPLQTSPQCILVHQSAGIESLHALRDVTLGIEVATPYAAWLVATFPMEGVTVVPPGGGLARWLAEPGYAQQAYAISEPYVAEREGGDPRCLLIAELGFNPYSSVLIARRSMVEQEPQLVRSVVQRSVAGWKAYLADPAATNQTIARLNDGMDEAALAWGVDAMRPLVEGPDGVGQMTRTRWQELHDQMLGIELIEEGQVDVDRLFDSSFLAAP